MTPESGFIDLRINRLDGQSDEGFWPSFTDIMMVVVMIFLLSMIILLMRNLELVNQLRATIAAERTATELARTTGEEKDSLAHRLISTENELSMLRLNLMRLEEQREQQEIAIASQQRQADTIGRERDSLAARLGTVTRESGRLRDELSTAKRELGGLQQDFSQLQQRHSTATDELLNLRSAYTAREQEISQLRTQSRAADQKLASLEGNYADLKVRYDKLLRPARTPRGKYVVEIRYFKQGGIDHIDYKQPGDNEFRALHRTELDQKLASLKKRHPDKLYIKVIFPKNSGLSYNEAWSFTHHLHSRYDYYFQDPIGGNRNKPTD